MQYILQMVYVTNEHHNIGENVVYADSMIMKLLHFDLVLHDMTSKEKIALIKFVSLPISRTLRMYIHPSRTLIDFDNRMS